MRSRSPFLRFGHAAALALTLAATRPVTGSAAEAAPAPARQDAATLAASAAAGMPEGARFGPSSPPAPNAATTDLDDKGIDPEPDIAIKPPANPIQAPSAKPTVAATPSDATRPAEGGTPMESAKATDEPLPVLNAAIKLVLDRRAAAEIRGPHAAERRKERQAIGFFYLAHGFAPLWSAEGTAVAATTPVLARLAHAGDDALRLPATPAALKAAGTPEEIAESEVALSEAVVSYARQASGSRIDPHAIAALIGLRPDLADATEALESVAAAGLDAGERLRAFNPVEPRYRALRDKLMELRAARTPTAAVASANPDARTGMRVPLVRARVSLDGTPDGEPQVQRYTTEVAAAGAGKVDGLAAPGILTRRTVAALSGGRPSRLEGQLVANMEMWRWMPRELGADHIEVNVPDFTVTVYRDGVATSKNRVVVGKKDTPTPLFSNAMQVVIVNPVWNVPESIIRKEMLPKLAQDPGYLDRLGYTVTERNGHLVVRQPSGERNALGRVKFIFPNDYAVYLHDTPSKALFATARRAYSHGCVRVDQPFRFAASVLNQDKWSEKRLTGLLGDAERHVSLPRPLPIHIEYFTAGIDESGRLALRDDVYDYVHRIASALGEES